MSVLVDTSVWSLALRREARHLSPRERVVVQQWSELVVSSEALLIGPVRQEVLSGIHDDRIFESLADRLDYFTSIELESDDYDLAAKFYNVLRSRGVTSTPTDVLLCAVAHRRDFRILTIDRDFTRFQSHLALRIYELD